MDVENDEQSTAVSIIKNIFYVKNVEAQLLNGVEVAFQHPFNSQILLDTSSDRSSEELIQQVLEVDGEQNQENGKLSADAFTVHEESVTYMDLPVKVKSQLRDMFVKPRLTVEVKSRGSIIAERKLSCASTSSSKRSQATKAGTKKPRKHSNVSQSQFDLQRTRGKRSSADFLNFYGERKKSKCYFGRGISQSFFIQVFLFLLGDSQAP